MVYEQRLVLKIFQARGGLAAESGCKISSFLTKETSEFRSVPRAGRFWNREYQRGNVSSGAFQEVRE